MRQKAKKYYLARRRAKYLGLAGCCGMLGLMVVAMLCPVCDSKVQAQGESEDAATVDTRAFLQSVVSLSLQSGVEFDVTPTIEGSFGAGMAELAVSTNNASGYSLYMRTENGENTLANAKGDAIAAVSGDQTPGNFQKNTWGYALGQGIDADTATYSAVPTNAATPVLSSGEVNGSAADKYTLAFGVKAATDLPSGEYSNSVVISAIANPMELTGLSQLTYMQEMTKEICAESAKHDEKMLIDERDNNSYYVTRLKDGNCWMTQNLALDLDGTRVYGGQTEPGVPIAYTDGRKGLWSGTGNGSNNLPKVTEGVVPEKASVVANDIRSWNLGKYVLANPQEVTNCTEVSTGEPVANCNRLQEIDSSWTPNFDAKTEGNDSVTTVDTMNKRYDAHYLIGNYYQYNTVTAGTGVKVTGNGDNAEASICPSGVDGNWTLPTSGPNTGTGSFSNLVDQYNANVISIIQLPLAFVRNGYITLDVGGLFDVGRVGWYWSCTSNNRNISYYMEFYPGGVHPSMTQVGGRWNGYSARCLFLGE